MGFFSKLIGGVLGAFAPSPTAVVPRAISPFPAPSPPPFPVAPAFRALTRSRATPSVLAGGQRAQALPANAPCPGNAATFRETVVNTIDRATGQIVCWETLKGSPFIMRSDIIIAKRVIRMATKLGNVKGLRGPARKQSTASRLKDAIEHEALEHVIGGHNGERCK